MVEDLLFTTTKKKKRLLEIYFNTESLLCVKIYTVGGSLFASFFIFYSVRMHVPAIMFAIFKEMISYG